MVFRGAAARPCLAEWKSMRSLVAGRRVCKGDAYPVHRQDRPRPLSVCGTASFCVRRGPWRKSDVNDATLSNSPNHARPFGVMDEELAAELKKSPGKRPAHQPVGELLSRHWAAVFSYASLCTSDPQQPVGEQPRRHLLNRAGCVSGRSSRTHTPSGPALGNRPCGTRCPNWYARRAALRRRGVWGQRGSGVGPLLTRETICSAGRMSFENS